MATITITREITAPHLTRAQTALKDHFGLPSNATNTQILAAWEQSVWSGLIGLVKGYEAKVAKDAAAAGVTEISLT